MREVSMLLTSDGCWKDNKRGNNRDNKIGELMIIVIAMMAIFMTILMTVKRLL